MDKHTTTTTRTALITGGTTGLGLECARALLRSPRLQWEVILAARNESNGERAVEMLNGEAGRPAARFRPLDLGSLRATRAFAQDMVRRQVRLDALVCNAGVQLVGGVRRTEDGFESTFGVNHLGHFLLVHGLARLLTAKACVFVVSGGTHDPSRRTGIPAPKFLPPEWLARPELDICDTFGRDFSSIEAGQRRYSTSKLCNLYFVYELNRRLRALAPDHPLAQVTVNAFDPGLMPGTGLARDYPLMQWLAWRYLMPALKPVLRWFMGDVNSPATSGHALASLIRSTFWPIPSGGYFVGLQATQSSTESYDLDNARALWAVSEELVKLDPTDRLGASSHAMPPYGPAHTA